MGIGALIMYLLCKVKPAAVAEEEQVKYSCSGDPCYICYQDDPNGAFSSLAECEASCTGAVPIDITVEEN